MNNSWISSCASQDSQASIEINGKTWTFGYVLYCTLHNAVPQPGRLLQQPYIASIGVTPRANGVSCAFMSKGTTTPSDCYVTIQAKILIKLLSLCYVHIKRQNTTIVSNSIGKTTRILLLWIILPSLYSTSIKQNATLHKSIKV